MPITTNRISHLLEPAPAPRARRTSAQREASRRNGARSSGPKTAAGKSRSRLNALKHGLLARVIAPRADFRQDDRLYWSIRRQLVAEFKPTRFSDHVELTGLASNLVQLTRARKMLEALQQPGGLSGETEQRWERYQEARRELKLLTRVIADGQRGRYGGCPATEASTLATRVAELVGDTREYLDQLAEDRRDDPNLEATWDQFERDEVARMEGLGQIIGAAGKRLGDASYVRAVLDGSQRPHRGDGRRLMRLLEHLATLRRQRLGEHDAVKQQVEVAKERATSDLARLPGNLLVIQRYVRKFELAVERAMKRLRK